MKNRLVIEAGTELRIPTGKMEGWTLTALDGPAVTITVDSAPLSVGDTVGAGEVVITRAQDGSSNDTWVEFDDGEAGATGEPGPAGRGIASITVSNGHLTGTYSDGTPWDAGALPAGSGGGLDAEAVQDILGTMLGEAQGHYDDAAGTYTINLPSGTSMTDEQVQDIVGALVKAGANTAVAYDDAAGTLTISSTGGGLSAVSHDSTLAGAGTPDNPLRVLPQASGGGGGGGVVALRSGYGVIEAMPNGVALNADMSANTYGQYLDLRYVAVQDITFRQIKLIWKTMSYPGTTLVEAHLTGSDYAVSSATRVASTQAPAVSESAWTTSTLTFDADVALLSGDHLVLRVFGTSSGGMMGIQAATVALPLTLSGGSLRFEAGVGQTDSGAAIGKAPAVSFLAGLTKRVVGPLDAVDFPVVPAVSDIPNGGGARLSGTNNFYLRRDTGQLLEFVGTPVSG